MRDISIRIRWFDVAAKSDAESRCHDKGAEQVSFDANMAAEEVMHEIGIDHEDEQEMGWRPGYVDDCVESICRALLTAYLQGLEDAAKKCEEKAEKRNPSDYRKAPDSEFADINTRCKQSYFGHECAAAIRQLAEKGKE